MDQKTILIIEDETAQAAALRIALEKAGYKIEVAYNAREGIEKVGRLIPNLVMLDLILAGADGTHILASINREAHLKHIPVMILTNLADSPEAKNLMQEKDCYMTKTEFSLKEIVDKVNEILK